MFFEPRTTLAASPTRIVRSPSPAIPVKAAPAFEGFMVLGFRGLGFRGFGFEGLMIWGLGI